MPISYINAASLDGSQSGSAPIYGARAWVNFNGTGTVAIRAAGNVSSITDNGVGDYNVNLTAAMPDGNYSFVATGSIYDAVNNATGLLVSQYRLNSANPTTTSFRLSTTYNNSGLDTRIDPGITNVAVFR